MKRLLVWIAGSAVDLFYRHKRLGADLPEGGPLLLVANHPNGLVDPALVLQLTARDVHFLGKEPLFRIPVLGALVRAFGVLPVYRVQDGADTGQNARTFEAVWSALERGEAVALFPEGKSHSEPGIQKLKTGAARMALGAEARRGFALGVRVVPIGLTYAEKSRFRSRVASWVGEPIACADLAELWQRDERAAVTELNERIARALSRVTVDLDRWEDLPLLQLAERLWRPARGPQRVARLAALAEGLRLARARAPERVHALQERVADLGARLERLDLAPDDLRIDYGPALVARFVLANALALAVGVPLFLAGALFWLAPYRLVDALAARREPTEDVAATVKLLAGLVVYPAWLTGLALGFGGWLGWPVGLALALAAPPLGVFALRFHERRSAALEDAATFARFASARSLRGRLQRRCDELAREIESLARDVAPEALIAE